ncbi:MAG: HepT-like ribonuclease domain-containing protein [Candidatus Methanospirareceae archaeon]
MKREIGDYIQDIIDAMNKAKKFVEGMEYEDFIRDDKTIFAVIRVIEVIGEAVKNIPEDVKKEYPEIPWREMAGMRDKLIHGYFGVNLKRVWKTVNEEIPPLKPLFEKLLRNSEK